MQDCMPTQCFSPAKLPACKEYSTLSVKLKGDTVIVIGSPYQINKPSQYPLPGTLVCVLIKLVVISEFSIEF